MVPDDGLPVLLEEGTAYLQLRRHSSDPSRFDLVVDWPSSLESSSASTTLRYKKMTAIARNFPNEEIYETDDLLPRLSRFVVLDTDVVLWFERHVAGSPAFAWTEIGRVADARIVEVRRR